MGVKYAFSFFWYWLVLINSGYGQFIMEDFLSTAKEDLSLQPALAKMDFLRRDNFNAPWISRVEFRSRSNDANIGQEDFRFRLTPANPAELKANKRYYAGQLSLLDLEYQEEFNGALRRRYLLVVEHVFEFKKGANLTEQLEQNRDLLSVIRNNPEAYNLDLGDFIQTASNELDLSLSLEDSKIRLNEIEYLMKGWYEFSGSIDWKNTDLIETSDILNLFEEFKDKPNGRYINLVRMDQENTLAAERFNIEKSESLRNIGFFQVEYDTDRGDDPSEHFGYQIGIRIPIVNPDKPDLNRRKLALMDDEALLEKKQFSYQRDLELAVLRMGHYARQYGEIASKMEDLSKQNFLGLNNPDKGVRISDLVKINEFYSDLFARRNSVERKIFETYLEYLDLTGKLSEAPLRNYLSKNLTEF